MKQIKQFRYYDANNSQNYPSDFGAKYYGMLTAGNIFDGHGDISHLGIQAMPGTKFYLNDSPLPIMIGSTGIYELELEGLGHIYKIKFDANSLDLYEGVTNTNRILIDIVYEGSD